MWRQLEHHDVNSGGRLKHDDHDYARQLDHDHDRSCGEHGSGHASGFGRRNGFGLGLGNASG